MTILPSSIVISKQHGGSEKGEGETAAFKFFRDIFNTTTQ